MPAEPAILEGCAVLPAMDVVPQKAPKRRYDPRRAIAGERFRTLNTFCDFTLGGLSRAELAVWLLLWRDSRGEVARTALADLARRAGVTTKTVGRAVASLRERNLLVVVFRGGLRRGPSAYRVHPLAGSGKGTRASLSKGTNRARGRGHRCPPSHKGP